MEKVSFSKGQEANVSGLWHQTEGTSRQQPTIMLHAFETGAIATKNIVYILLLLFILNTVLYTEFYCT